MFFKFTCYFFIVHKNIALFARPMQDFTALDEWIIKQAPAKAERSKAVAEKSLEVLFAGKNKEERNA